MRKTKRKGGAKSVAREPLQPGTMSWYKLLDNYLVCPWYPFVRQELYHLSHSSSPWYPFDYYNITIFSSHL
jgi:hypothetical protein